MADLSGFNANEVDPNFGFEPIPAGIYTAAITESEEKDTKAGTGSYVQLVFEILEGEFKGRKVWARLNLNNPNKMAVQIAQAELSAICRAVDVMQPQSSEDLHGIPLNIKVGMQKNSNNGDLSNVIKAYSKIGSKTEKPSQSKDDRPWK